ncbi:MAG TPA: hypothetical protein VK470_16105, partial [Bacteroidota bacterium]|nr:hypothetical protein [Bacteroidota bacterium]
MRFLLFIVCMLLGEFSLLMELSRQYTKIAQAEMRAATVQTRNAAAEISAAPVTTRNGTAKSTRVKIGFDAQVRRAGLFIAGKGGALPVPVDSVCEVMSVSSGNDSRKDAAALGEAIVFRIRNLGTLIDHAAKERSALVVYVDGMPLKGISPSAIVREQDEIAFTLLASGPARELWTKYLSIRGRDHFFTQDVAVTVGLENGKFSASMPAQTPNFSLVLIRRPLFFFCAVLAVLLLLLFHIVAYKSDLLRDGGLDPATGRKPYSLSRTQMALWFFVVTVSFL